MAENSPRTPVTESTLVRRCAYIAFMALFLWLVFALATRGEFAAPLVGTLVGLVLIVPMYLREQETQQARETRAAADRRHEGRAQGTSRWDVDDRGPADPVAPTKPQPKILEN